MKITSGNLSAPPAILIGTWLFVIVLRLMPIISFENIPFFTYAYVATCLVIFLIGFWMGYKLYLPIQSSSDLMLSKNMGNHNIKIILIFTTLGLLGAILRTYDFIYLRGLDYSLGIGSARLENMKLVNENLSEFRYLSALGRSLIGFSTVSAMIAVLRFEVLPWRIIRYAFFSFLMMIFLSVIEGGRNTIIVNIIIIISCFVTRSSTNKKPIPSHYGLKIILFCAVMLSISFVIYIWLDRMSALGYDQLSHIQALESGFNIEFYDWIKDGKFPFISQIFIVLSGIILYITHGLNEFSILITSNHELPLSYGAYNFDLIITLLGYAIGQNLKFEPTMLDRQGVYLTALGELYLDFGLLGLLSFIAMLSICVGINWKKLQRQNLLFSELLNSYTIAGIIVSPLYSIVAGFLGIFISIVVYKIFQKKL